MYFKLSNGAAFLSIIIVAWGLPIVSYAEQQQQNAELHIKPTMCVALNQGRTCYAQVNIQWNTLIKDDFCIFQKTANQQKQLKCWKNTQANSLSFGFESNESITYQLINKNNKSLAEATIEVSWVHEKSPRKRRWRLF